MSDTAIEAIVIGASAGAIEALSLILPSLPRGYPLPVLVVVHVPSDKTNILTELFRKKCDISVVEAADKEPVRGGTVYFAPPGYHLLVEMDKTLSLSNDEPVFFSRPSVDVLFESAADAYGPALLGIILTGASQDGANGLAAVVHCGGQAVIQVPDQAYASAMPRAAMAVTPAARILPVIEIAHYLRSVGKV